MIYFVEHLQKAKTHNSFTRLFKPLLKIIEQIRTFFMRENLLKDINFFIINLNIDANKVYISNL